MKRLAFEAVKSAIRTTAPEKRKALADTIDASSECFQRKWTGPLVLSRPLCSIT